MVDSIVYYNIFNDFLVLINAKKKLLMHKYFEILRLASQLQLGLKI